MGAQAAAETLFAVFYLTTVIFLGMDMLMRAPEGGQFRLFGLMAVLLGAGDAFHLIPRAQALWTTGLEANAAALGIGKLITGVTMTVFYVLLYEVWRRRYGVQGRRGLTAAVYGLAALRIALNLLPQNEWLAYRQPLAWGIYRNVPFALMGIILIVLFQRAARAHGDRALGRAWLAVALSFAFYIPVVLFADAVPAVGALMIPKTLAYAWLVWLGYQDFRRQAGPGIAAHAAPALG